MMYLTFIEGGSTTFCKFDLPIDHKNYSVFGGIQSAISLDLIAEMGRYTLRKGWLDTTFNGTEW
jgi:hypothetical protein